MENLTKLQLINTDLKKAIRMIVTTDEIDSGFEDRIRKIMSTVPRPHTTTDFQKAQKQALKSIVLMQNQKQIDYETK